MRNLKKNKQYILILLITIPTLLALSSLMTNVQGGPDDIPIEGPNNAWHWDVAVGDQIYFEGEFILTNVSTGEIYRMFKDIWIYNITSIKNVTIDAGFGVRDYSQINATQCYYDLSEIKAYDDPQEIALFGYHELDPFKHKYRAGHNGVPFILPLNDSTIDVDVLDDILDESFYGSPLYQMAFNRFNYYESDPATNRIYFYNDSEYYFADTYYFDDGTLKNGTAFLTANMGDGPLYINATIKQVFDYNIIDEIEWDVIAGNTFYYDSIEDERIFDNATEWKITITGFSPILLNKTKNSFSDEDPIYMVYQAVFADRFKWNGTDYEFDNNTIIGAANNFYPLYYDDAAEGGVMPFIWPINVPREDYEFMWNNDTLRIWEGLRFDEVYISENGFFDIYLKNSTSINYVKLNINKATGVAHLFQMLSMDDFIFFELKTQTLVDWSVNIDDIIYLKRNDNYDNPFIDLRVTILGTYTYFMNMTFLMEYYNYYGIPMTLPSGQPELQFFSYILAYYEEWNPFTQSWDYDDIRELAIANIYWPISPLVFLFGGAPLLLPEGTSSSELTDLFDAFSPVYDFITYSTGSVILRNSTLDRSLNFYFNETSGRVTALYGWGNMPGPGGGNWNYMSYYPKFYQPLSDGPNSFSMNSDFITDMTVTVELNVAAIGGPLPEYIYNFLPMNPVNVSVPEGTPLAYFDQLITYPILIVGNITMTMTLPSSIDLNNIELHFYAYNMSGTLEWDEAPPEIYAAIIYDYDTNSFTIETPTWPWGTISAISYVEVEEEEEPIIPGYNVLIFMIGIIILSALLIKWKRK